MLLEEEKEGREPHWLNVTFAQERSHLKEGSRSIKDPSTLVLVSGARRALPPHRLRNDHWAGNLDQTYSKSEAILLKELMLAVPPVPVVDIMLVALQQSLREIQVTQNKSPGNETGSVYVYAFGRRFYPKRLRVGR